MTRPRGSGDGWVCKTCGDDLAVSPGIHQGVFRTFQGVPILYCSKACRIRIPKKKGEDGR